MAVGDQNDIYNRLISQLPPWFGTDHPNLDALLAAYVGFTRSIKTPTTAYFHYNNQYLYAKLQLRVQTATDINLDLIAQDNFGPNLPRLPNETDGSYRQRILGNLPPQGATRQAMINKLFILTRHIPVIIEPQSGIDQGYYHQPATLAYNTYGAYGSFSYPYQFWVYAFLDSYTGMGKYPGYNLNSYASAFSISSGGSSYNVGDFITLAGGVFSSPIIMQVNTVSSGAITSATIYKAGVYQEPLPSNPLLQNSTTGSGSGASFNITWSAFIPNMGYSAVNSGWYGSFSLENASVTFEDVNQVVQNTKVLGTLQHIIINYV